MFKWLYNIPNWGYRQVKKKRKKVQTPDIKYGKIAYKEL